MRWAGLLSYRYPFSTKVFSTSLFSISAADARFPLKLVLKRAIGLSVCTTLWDRRDEITCRLRVARRNCLDAWYDLIALFDAAQKNAILSQYLHLLVASGVQAMPSSYRRNSIFHFRFPAGSAGRVLRNVLFLCICDKASTRDIAASSIFICPK